MGRADEQAAVVVACRLLGLGQCFGHGRQQGLRRVGAAKVDEMADTRQTIVIFRKPSSSAPGWRLHAFHGLPDHGRV